MGNLINDFESKDDPRQQIPVQVPPPPPPSQPAPQDSSFSGIQAGAGNIPLQSAPQPGQLEQQLASPPMAPQGPLPGPTPDVTDPTATGVTTPLTPASPPLADIPQVPDIEQNTAVPTPTNTPGSDPALLHEQMQQQIKQRQFEQEQNALHSNSESYLTSGNVLPTVYQGETAAQAADRHAALDRNLLTHVSREVAQTNMNAANMQPLASVNRPGNQFQPDSTQQALNHLPGMVQRSPWDYTVDAAGNMLDAAGKAIGLTHTSGTFDPTAGFRHWGEEVQKNPWQILNPLNLFGVVPTVAGAHFRDYGDGAFGTIMYSTSIRSNVVKGALTDLSKVVSGQERWNGEAVNTTQAVLGKNFDFTQGASKESLGVIGPSTVPRTEEDLRKRSWLYSNPLVSSLVHGYQMARTALTGKHDLGLSDMPITIQGWHGETVGKVPLGALLTQGVEMGTGLAMDLFVDTVTLDPEHAIGLAKRVLTGEATHAASHVVPKVLAEHEVPAVKPAEIPTEVQTSPAPTTPAAVVQTPVKPMGLGNGPSPEYAAKRKALMAVPGLDEHGNLIAGTPAITTPKTTSVTGVRHTIDPESVTINTGKESVIKQSEITPPPEVHKIMQELHNAPAGTQVNPDLLVNVERSNQNLTELAKFNGDITPTRTNALSSQRLEALGSNYPPNENPYRAYGPNIDGNKLSNPDSFIELSHSPAPGELTNIAKPIGKQPIQAAVDVPLPTDLQGTVEALKTRAEAYKLNHDVDARQQISHEIDKLLDNFTNVPDITQSASLAQVNQNLEKALRTTSPVGIAKLQEFMDKDFAYRDSTVKFTQAQQQMNNVMSELQVSLDKLDEAPDLGRRTIQNDIPFQPSPGKISPEVTPAADHLNSLDLYHGSRVRGLDLQAIDPLQGSARHELGPGMYLTSDTREATSNAVGSIHRNLPSVPGREFDEVGTVYKAKTAVRNPLDASVSPPTDVRDAFLSAIKDTQPQPIYKAMVKGLHDELPLNKYYTMLDEKISKFYSSYGFPESEALSSQRIANSRIRALGYDAIVSGDGKSTMVNVLGGTPQNSLAGVEKVSAVGSGDLIAQAAERFNAASRTAERFKDNRVVATQMEEAKTTLSTRLAEQARSNYEAAAKRVEDYATNLQHTEQELRDIVKSERVKLQDIRSQEAARVDEKRIEIDSKPNNNPCNF